MPENKLEISVVEAVFGLAFDIERDPSRPSGFKPASVDLGSGKAMFGEIRLGGFAALLRTGFAKHLTIVGGDEGRYRGEEPVINRAWAIREMLVKDCGIDESLVTSFASNSNTGGNITIIKREVEERGLTPGQVAVVTSYYHAPRAAVMMAKDGLVLPVYPAEALVLLEGIVTKEELANRHFGGGSLAERLAEEIQGVAALIRGNYTPRTDAAASVA